MAPLRQGPGQVVVAGDEVGEEREAVEAGVATGVEDEEGGDLYHEVKETAAEDGLDLLGDHRGRAAGVRDGVGPLGQQGGAEHEERQDRAHDDQGLAGMDRLGPTEGAHPVGDGLEPGQRRATVGKGPQQRDEGQAHQPALARRPYLSAEKQVRRRERGGVEVPERLFDVPGDDDDAQAEHVEIGGDREEFPGLADAAQVAVQEQQDDADRDSDGVEGVGQARDGARQGGRARRRLHGDRDGVVDQERYRGDLGDPPAEVVPGHHVGAAGLCVELDDVEIRERHEEEDAEDGHGDRDDQGERSQPDVRHELGQHLLGPVGRGRDAVGRQHTQCGRSAQSLRAQLFGHQWRPEQLVLQAIEAPLGDAVGHEPRQRDRWPRTWTGRHGASVEGNRDPLGLLLFAQRRVACCAVACT